MRQIRKEKLFEKEGGRAANVMSMINQELLLGLRNMIQPDVLDPTDVCRTINPYWALMQFEEDEAEREQVATKMFARMEELKQEADRVILFIESAYVREGYRRNGMMRLMLDVADVIAENPIMWLNLEPTAGFELDEEYTYLPHYVQAAEGQLSENAAAAEKLGFTIDPDVWHKRIYIEDENGNVRDEVVEMRKCAYKIPSEIKEIIKDDGNLVEIGRAKQKALHMKQEVEAYNDGVVDIYSTSLDSDEYKDLENNWTMIQDEGSTFYDENGEKKGCVHEVAYRCESGLREGDVVYLYGMFMNGEKSFVESETSMLKMIREENFPQDDNELRAWEYESLEETSISEFSEVFVELSTVLDEIMNEKTKI